MKFLFLFILFATILNGNILIDNNSKKIDSFKMFYYNDTTGSLDIKDISKISFNQTISNNFTLTALKGSSWFKFTLLNNSNNENILLNMNEGWFDKLNLYTLENGNFFKSEAGINVLLKDKEMKNTSPTFNLHIKKGENKTFYIEINTYMSTLGIFTIYLNKDSYLNDKIISIALYAFYIGAAFIVFILNLFLFYTLREIIYAYYSLYVLIFSTYVLVFSGMTEYISYGSFYRLEFLSPVSMLFLILFSKELLVTSLYTPRLNKSLTILSIMMLILSVLVFLDAKSWYILYTRFVPFVAIIILSASIISWKKGNDDAKYYIIFMSMYIISLFILVMLSLGVVEYNNFTRYSFIISSFFEMSFFSLVLANRFHKTKIEKNIVEIALKNTKKLAHHDKLTGLYNRHYLESCFTHSFNNARNKEQELCIIMLDIDKFKLVNDTYGHDIGDIVLKNVSSVFTSITRESDVVARYGGEEFIIILQNTSVQNTQIIAEKIRVNIEELKTKYEGNKELSVTISLGISLLKNEDLRIESIIKRADKALYESKNSGRNKLSIMY